MEGLKGTGSHWRRALLIVGVILGGVIVARAFGFTAYLRFENLSRLTEAIEGYGVLGPVIFISAYVLGVVFFVPGLPMTLLGGLAFGPVRGAAYVWVAATIGAALAFLVARYGLRGLVEGWVARNARLTRMDEAVARDGWRIVMITRLVPLFPFNVQNYAYGVTRIGFWAYLTTSAVCMIPATVAYTFAGGALSRGGGELRRTVGYLAVAGVLIVLVSLIPRYLERRNRAAGALLNRAILLPLVTVLGVGPHPGSGSDAAFATLLASHLCPGTVAGSIAAEPECQGVILDRARAARGSGGRRGSEARELTVAETVCLIGVAVTMYSPRWEGGGGSGFDRPDDGAAQADSPGMRIVSAHDRQPFESITCWPSVGRASSMAVPILVSSEESAMSDETASHVRYIDKTRAYYQAEGYGKSYEWAHFEDIPFTPFASIGRALSRCRVGVVTTSELARRDAEAGSDDPRRLVYSLPTDLPVDQLYSKKASYDRYATSLDDVDSYLPLTHLHSFIAEGRIGAVAPRFQVIYSEYSQRKTLTVDAPEILKQMREDRVDVAVLAAV